MYQRWAQGVGGIDPPGPPQPTPPRRPKHMRGIGIGKTREIQMYTTAFGSKRTIMYLDKNFLFKNALKVKCTLLI